MKNMGAGQHNCRRWLDPYVSPHGAQADHSPLEQVVYDEWNKVKQDVNPNNPAAHRRKGRMFSMQFGISSGIRTPARFSIDTAGSIRTGLPTGA